MEKNNINNETPADRLGAVIIKYFRTQKDVAKLLEMDEGTLSSYISGRYNITKKFAMRLQTTIGINANYILKGIEPMMIDATRRPIFEGKVPTMSKVDTKVQNGIIKHYILQYEGDKQILKPNGESSVVNLVLGNLEENTTSFQVFNSLLEFTEDYGIPVNATLILKKDYKPNNLVLYNDSEEYKIGILNSEDIITEIKTKTKYRKEDVEIEGRIIGEYKNIRYNKTTGRIF